MGQWVIQSFVHGTSGILLPFGAVLSFVLPITTANAQGSLPAADISTARTILDTVRAEDLLRGNGSSSGYTLSHGGIVAASLVVVRNGSVLSADKEYTLDARGGILTFKRMTDVEETISVSYRYLPGAAGLTGKGTSSKSGYAPSYVSGLPSLNLVDGVGLGFVRGDTGNGTNALLGVKSSGLAYFSGGSMTGQAMSLTDKVSPNGSNSPTINGSNANQYLVAQSKTIGVTGAKITFDYQDVSKNFGNFAALHQMQAAPDADLTQLEKERGLKRLGLTGSFGGKTGNLLNFSQNELTGGSGDIRRQSLGFAAGGLSLSGNLLSVDRGFSRYKDLVDKDLPTGMSREQFEKELKGVTKSDLSGKWQVKKGLSFEGSQNSWSRDTGTSTKDLNDSNKWAINYAASSGLTFALLDESNKKVTGGKKEEHSTRTYLIGTDSRKPTGISYLTKSTKAVFADGRRHTETQSRIDGKTLIKLGSGTAKKPLLPPITLHGMQETLGVADTVGAKEQKSDTIATLFGVRLDGNAPLKLNYEQREKSTRTDHADTDVRETAYTADGQYQWNKNSLFSYMSASDVTLVGRQKTDNAKELLAFNLGRGYKYSQSLDKSERTAADGTMTETHTDLMSFATDPKEPIWVGGEEKEVQGDKDALEASRAWRSGINLGPLSFKMDGMGINRLRMANLPAREKNISMVGGLKLYGGWKAAYNFYDRFDKDPQTRLDRNEMLEEWILDSGTKSPLKMNLVNRVFDNRSGKANERTKQEMTFAPLKPLNIGFLRRGNITLAYGTDSIRHTDREGTTRRLIYDGNLGANKLALEFGEGRDANGLPALSKALTFTAGGKGRLQLTTRQGFRQSMKDEHTSANVWSRNWNMSYVLAKGQTFTYSLSLRPEKPDSTLETRRAEQFGYLCAFGKGGKFVAEHRSAADFAKDATTQSTLVSLVSQANPISSYEFTYTKEETRQGGKTSILNTYLIAYQFLPHDSPTSISVGARWFEQRGSIAIPLDVKDRTTATVEIKSAW